MLKRKHLVGVGVSVVLFAMFGLFIGQLFGVALGGVGFDQAVDGFETGPTEMPIYGTDRVVTLPAVEVTHRVFGVTVSLSGFTVAEVSMGGGAVFGFLVGLYYAVTIAREQRLASGASDAAEE